MDKARGGNLLWVAICDRHRNSDVPNATKTKASPTGEAFLDKAPGGDLLQPAIYDRSSTQRKTPTICGEG